MKARIIGLTGKRGVGKSECAGFLSTAGFVRAHPFDGGKAATAGYFQHLGADPQTAYRMIYGDMRDVPSDFLPDNATPRYFMEHLGKFMGASEALGQEWTLGLELRRLERRGVMQIVVESLVYEVESLRRAGGMVIRIKRPGVAGPAGIMTDVAEATITADAEVVNDGTLAELREKILSLAGVE